MDGLNSVFKKVTNTNKIGFKQIYIEGFVEELEVEYFSLTNTCSIILDVGKIKANKNSCILV